MVSKKNLTVSSVKESLVKPAKQCGKLDMIGKNIMEIKAGGNLVQDSVTVTGDDKTNGAAAVPLKGVENNQKDVIVTNADGCKTTDDVQRLAVLSFEQVRRLDAVMNEVVSIQGRGNFPTIEVSLKDLVKVVRDKLEEDAAGTTTAANGSSNNSSSNSYNNNADTAVGITGATGTVKVVKDIRLNGGAASYVLDTQESWQTYNDLDLIFAVELSSARHFERVKTAVLNSLLDLLPEGVSRKRISTCSLKEAYVSKMVKVNSEGDCWSLISLGNSRGYKNVELKFVDSMRRPFEFSVDSFQIVLDSLLLFYDCSDGSPIGETFYPTVVGDSVYGDFQEALYHLQKKLIATRNPEEIRGGGLLKYCNLLVRHYQPAYPENIKMLERYMCSRFFIDFPDINQQRCKLENYLRNHFIEPEEESIKYQYLLLLRSVVDESTVCLMGHERRQTLALIDDLAYQVYYYSHNRKYYPHHHATAPPAAATYLYANGYYYTPTAATTLLSPCACNSYLFAAAPPSSASSSSSSSATSAVNVANGAASTTVLAPPIDATAAPPSDANGYPDLQRHCNGSNVSSSPELEVAAATVDA